MCRRRRAISVGCAGLTIAALPGVRVAGLIIAAVIVAVWAMFHHGPVTTANAEVAVNQPVARLRSERSRRSRHHMSFLTHRAQRALSA